MRRFSTRTILAAFAFVPLTAAAQPDAERSDDSKNEGDRDRPQWQQLQGDQMRPDRESMMQQRERMMREREGMMQGDDRQDRERRSRSRNDEDDEPPRS